jgi:hypothetical protein
MHQPLKEPKKKAVSEMFLPKWWGGDCGFGPDAAPVGLRRLAADLRFECGWLRGDCGNTQRIVDEPANQTSLGIKNKSQSAGFETGSISSLLLISSSCGG